MTDEKMIRGTPALAERLLRHMTGQGSPLLEVGETWRAGEAVTRRDLELAIEELEDLLEGGITEEEREEISDLRAELDELSPDEVEAGPGAEIRRRRKALGWTQQELAERAGVRVATISNLETGKADRPRKSTLRLIHAALESGERPTPFLWTPERRAFMDDLRRRYEEAQRRSREIFSRFDPTEKDELADALREEQELWEELKAEMIRMEWSGSRRPSAGRKGGHS